MSWYEVIVYYSFTESIKKEFREIYLFNVFVCTVVGPENIHGR